MALVFGLVIMVMVYATGHLSGAHINPAVTIAFALTRHFPAAEARAYIAAQIAGATLAAGVLYAMLFGIVPLEKNLALYSWHGQHHVAHITELRKRMGWQ